MDDGRDRYHRYEASQGYDPRTLQIVFGALLGAAGAALIVQAARGHGQAGARALPMHGRRIATGRSIDIAATPEQVYDAWRDYENFPRFMSRVEEVRALDGARSHWVVKGPAGTDVSWDSVLTAQDRGRLLAWRSEPGGPVDHSGRVELQPTATGTRATVRLAYEAPGGRLGHAAASLFGRNPGQDLDRDLQRMKEHIESLHPRGAAGAQPWQGGTSGLSGSAGPH